ncbi:hypothetical protein BU24DRAFT_405604 [Aaosphaeria arxii CBS 175.79]|uniref:F-box domain-containing protein n=1 Tax=Aaosphaeria arxii CBS 175.79 TaxID=1450172 RepID=A0A6A5XZY4_9PLEO|nr:uncharacterized protein BU24DRAFT_405604 [Aaosphaeria arxii CBS 175.79]KAF2018858.1 hypothetical protein BU24DRAFT_405604 [Aaosphaeria arxii CBS 175.79]
MTSSRSGLLNAPTEILLEIIENLRFDKKSIAKLRSVHPRIRNVVDDYEVSITTKYMKRQLPHALVDFPGDKRKIGYRWLAECDYNYDVVDSVMAVLTCEENCWAVQRHNMPLANTGLLILYRLQSIEKHADKLAFIKNLPRDPLIAMFVAIHYSTLTARYHGHGIINQKTYGRFLDANQLELRNDVEFSFAEAAMDLGAQFIVDALENVDSSETALMVFYHEHTIHDWDLDTVAQGEFMPPVTQGPFKKPGTRPRSLYTTLLERMAELTKCPLSDVVDNTLDEVENPNHDLAWIDLYDKARLIAGLDLEE